MKVLITGGAGFIGCNSADFFLQQGHEVVIYDNFSRVGGQANVDWLYERHGGERLTCIRGELTDYAGLCAALPGSEVVLHLAGQVAVTSSVLDPRADFMSNALGTFNVLEGVRNVCPETAVLYASTNKVYGGMEEVGIVQQGDRYAYADYPYGISESYPLDFHSPYGCSKGTGDQYTLDYARIYGLRTVVFRQSCIYGRRQFGIEDQGWVAHFVIATVLNRPISIFGDGRQVRDVLNITDLVAAYDLAICNIDAVRGEAFNVGGGPNNTLSIWTEFGPLLEELAGHLPPVQRGSWRPGDQRVFVADIRKAQARLGWAPKVSPADGILDLYRWVAANKGLFA
ncbi:MAG: GDP-mannose 4,6-dehydratase [Anaerolineales bacterium]|nr:GDP-mannose 4,6-dehydratase [Anaerolineales bacterium]